RGKRTPAVAARSRTAVRAGEEGPHGFHRREGDGTRRGADPAGLHPLHQCRAHPSRPAAADRDRGGGAVRGDACAGCGRARTARPRACGLGRGAEADVLRRDPGGAAGDGDAGGRGAGRMGGADRPRGGIRTGGGGAVAGPALRPAGDARAAGAQGRHGGSGGAHALAEHAGRLAMSFVRPELAARMRPWREVLVWGAGMAGGIWLVWHGLRAGALHLLAFGVVAGIASGGLLVAALRRRRLTGLPPAEGVVSVREARIGYLGPRGGGFVDLGDLRRVDIVTDGRRQMWQLETADGNALRVPFGARGAEAIYDALAALVEIDEEALHAALATRRAGRFPVWVRVPDATLGRLP